MDVLTWQPGPSRSFHVHHLPLFSWIEPSSSYEQNEDMCSPSLLSWKSLPNKKTFCTTFMPMPSITPVTIHCTYIVLSVYMGDALGDQWLSNSYSTSTKRGGLVVYPCWPLLAGCSHLWRTWIWRP